MFNESQNTTVTLEEFNEMVNILAKELLESIRKNYNLYNETQLYY